MDQIILVIEFCECVLLGQLHSFVNYIVGRLDTGVHCIKGIKSFILKPTILFLFCPMYPAILSIRYIKMSVIN